MRPNKKYFKGSPSSKETRVNSRIKVKEVRLIDKDSQNVGVVNTKEALKLARNDGLDLVEVSANSKPPVCKIMDYGKYQYEQKKKQKFMAKNSQKHEDKEIRLTANINDHDLKVKAKKVKEFLEKGQKVNINVKLKGREKGRPEIAKMVVERLYDIVKEEATLEDKGSSFTLVPS